MKILLCLFALLLATLSSCFLVNQLEFDNCQHFETMEDLQGFFPNNRAIKNTALFVYNEGCFDEHDNPGLKFENLIRNLSYINIILMICCNSN